MKLYPQINLIKLLMRPVRLLYENDLVSVNRKISHDILLLKAFLCQLSNE